MLLLRFQVVHEPYKQGDLGTIRSAQFITSKPPCEFERRRQGPNACLDLGYFGPAQHLQLCMNFREFRAQVLIKTSSCVDIRRSRLKACSKWANMENGASTGVSVQEQPLSLSLLTSSTNVRLQALKTILQRFEDSSKFTSSTWSSSLTI